MSTRGGCIKCGALAAWLKAGVCYACNSPASVVTSQPYNGWANYETWNIALWLSNDESLYKLARKAKQGYKQLAIELRYSAPTTPDGVSWIDSRLDFIALDNLLKELT